MKRFLIGALIAALGGLLSFVFGQSLPRRWFHPQRAFYKCFDWEDGGKIYLKLGVHKWKDLVPDMSRIIPGVFKKKAGKALTPEMMWRLVQETCVAELVHWLLVVVVSPAVFAAIGGFAGIACAALYAAGNLVFVIIQRYNRPRLLEIHKRMEKRKERCS